MRTFKLFAVASLAVGLLFAGTQASATTVTTTFTLDTAIPVGPGVTIDTSDGVSFLALGAADLCDASGQGLTGITGNALITSFCGGAYGQTALFFDHYLTSLTLNYATSDTGLLSVLYGDLGATDPAGFRLIGYDTPCPAMDDTCIFEGILTISGVAPFNVVLIDFDQAGYPDYALDNITVTAILTPEPSSVALLGTGVLGIAGAIRRRRK